MESVLTRFLKEEEAQGMVEYGLIIALVALVIIGALTAMGGQLKTIFNNIVSGLGGTPAP
ncbi:MAG: Flp family type IVb pilin [Firmicutes bacterium]|nr:Flp family type IVb pilin [Bacillota bacterium]